MAIRTVERAFALLDIMRRKSDSAHPLTLSQIETLMEEKGHTQARQSTIACLDTLAECGYDIKKLAGSSPASYYFDRREVAAEDVETVADMLAASRYVTKQQAQRITEASCWALSDYERSEVTACAVSVGARRTESDTDWSHSPRIIRRAIEHGDNISFKYIDYNAEGIAIERHDGKTYACAPLALLYSGGTYYMQATEDGEKAKTFRVDHMRNVKATSSTVDGNALRKELDTSKLTERAFSMYEASDGKDRRVELQVEPQCISSVVDYFKDRKSCDMSCSDLDGSCMAVTVTIQPSPTFFGWVAQYLGGVKISAPDDIRRRFDKAVSKLAER